MKVIDMYGGASNQYQPPDSSNSPADTTTQQKAAATPSAGMANATAVSWVGIVIALVVLRVVYEVSD